VIVSREFIFYFYFCSAWYSFVLEYNVSSFLSERDINLGLPIVGSCKPANLTRYFTHNTPIWSLVPGAVEGIMFNVVAAASSYVSLDSQVPFVNNIGLS